jgi:predicted NUDIX family phosphoesterase
MDEARTVSDVRKQAEALHVRAKRLHQAMRVGARRAFVLELTGTPKAGKTTSLGTLQHFFKSAGFKVHTLKERAADCPLPMKGHFFFNAWTTATMLAEVLATFDTDVDLLILDRGFFDALIWLELQYRRGQVSAHEREVFSKFVLLDRWRSLVDLTVLMTSDPTVSLEREDRNLLISHRGSMMNPEALAEFNAAVETACDTYGGRFKLLAVDTTKSKDVLQANTKLISKLLPIIEEWANPTISAVPRSTARDVFKNRKYIYLEDAKRAWQKLIGQIKPRRRATAESDDSTVQIVAAGIPVHQRKIFVFSRGERDEKAASYGKATIWKGLHIQSSEIPSLAYVKRELTKRLQEELHLKLSLSPEFIGIAWDESVRVESRHLGLMFRVPIENAVVANSMHKKEFRKAGRGHKLTGQFITQEAILSNLNELNLEPWSKHVVSNVELPND